MTADAINIAINGLGRIGSMAMRAVLERPELALVGINDPLLTAEAMVYFLRYDSVHGRSPHRFEAFADRIEVVIEGRPTQIIKVYAEKNPADITWSSCGADYILECTGQFLTTELAKSHLSAGAKRVVLSAPSKDDTPMFVMGVNHDRYQGESTVSNASCTTNCLAPIAKVMHEAFGIEAGLMSTVHAVTATQKVTDSISKRDWRSGRTAFNNIIPASTGAANAVGKVLPELAGKLTGMAFRVPTLDVSVVDLTCQLASDATLESIKEQMQRASEGPLKGVLGYTNEALVSSDFIGESCTSIFDAGASLCLTPRFVKLVSWYDNEWGYASKLLDLIEFMQQSHPL